MRRILMLVVAAAVMVPMVGSAAQPARAASPPEECAARRLYKTLWCENFDTLDTTKWNVTVRGSGGSVAIVGDELAVRANAGPLYPYLTRSTNAGPVFPSATTPYELEVKFHYVSVGSNGAGFYSLHGSTPAGSVHQDTSGIGVTSGCGSSILRPQTTAEYIARYTVEPGPGTRVHLTTVSSSSTANGTACPAAPPWPGAFMIGNNATGGAGGAWSNINVDYVRVDIPCRETGTVSANVATVHSAIRGVDPVPADAVQDVNCDVVVANGL